MLVEIKKLSIQNLGHKREIEEKKIYINTENVVSVVDYEGVLPFLVSENSRYAKDKFSLIKISSGSSIEEIIAIGSSEQVFTALQGTLGKKILHD